MIIEDLENLFFKENLIARIENINIKIMISILSTMINIIIFGSIFRYINFSLTENLDHIFLTNLIIFIIYLYMFFIFLKPMKNIIIKLFFRSYLKK